MKNISALFVGLLFGLGLASSGMTDTQKVLGFLDVLGEWVPDLLFVMAGAVITTAIGFKGLFYWRKQPIFSEQFFVPNSKHIDKRLVVGASLFGIGWGLYGYCPGPALASLVYFSPITLLFVFCMLIGMIMGDRIAKRCL